MRNVLPATNKVCLDTNVLVYSADTSAGEKHEIANQLIADLTATDELVHVAHNLSEFFNIMTRPNKPFTMPPEQALIAVADFAATSTVYPVTIEAILLAGQAVSLHLMSFWDALIWAVAKLNGVTTIYTEDTQSASSIDGVQYINPFVKESIT